MQLRLLLPNFSRDKRASFTWNSNVFGFEMWTASAKASSGLSLSLDEMSSLEQRLNVKASVKPDWDKDVLSRSVNLFMGCWVAIVIDFGIVFTMLL